MEERYEAFKFDHKSGGTTFFRGNSVHGKLIGGKGIGGIFIGGNIIFRYD